MVYLYKSYFVNICADKTDMDQEELLCRTMIFLC